jgi:hypothetical protein
MTVASGKLSLKLNLMTHKSEILFKNIYFYYILSDKR